MAIADAGEAKGRIAVVIPCYNAGNAVASVVARAIAVVSRVIVVDDGSTDGCTAPLSSMPVTMIVFPANRGKGFALLEGFRAALAMPDVEAAVVLDADGQHDPAEIPALCEKWRETGADLIIGARTFDRRLVPFWSWFGNVATVRVMAWLFGIRLPDTQSGFRLHGRRFLESVVETIPGGRYETEMAIVLKALREGYAVATTPIRTVYEAGNPTSHFRRLRDSMRVYRTLVSAWFRRRR
ncbi:MAG TPA: glycosyltransferase family 2 protein [Candidatus Hydrogenedentes bacterium]|nr:glycosyltransferase family 2 protein [Candidatus Hydrogenedentota bacterium]